MKIADAILKLLPKNAAYVSISHEIYLGDKEECLTFSLESNGRSSDLLKTLHIIYLQKMSPVSKWTLELCDEVTEADTIGFVRNNVIFDPRFSIRNGKWEQIPDFEYVRADVQKIIALCDITNKKRAGKCNSKSPKKKEVGEAKVEI